MNVRCETIVTAQDSTPPHDIVGTDTVADTKICQAPAARSGITTRAMFPCISGGTLCFVVPSLNTTPAKTSVSVGSDQANLVLSDERADSVASLLTSMFDIPAENLTTQGYGEQYLKVDTQEANRQNRRVTIRRITPLVAPVASAN